MKKKPTDKVRRFTPVEVGYHAVQGILYLILFGTGALLLVQRIMDFTWITAEQLSKWHRIVGIVMVIFLLQIIILSIFSRQFRVFWRNLWEAMHWGFRDIVWLIKMPLSIFAPHINLPPSRRFNPGQSLHLLTVTIAIIGFSISGLIMIALPGSLGAWLIHIICFIPALLFLGLHSFLTLINPPTRKALMGMISGFVPRRYAQGHHALWINEPMNGGHSDHLSQRAVVYSSVVLVILMCGLMWVYGFAHFKQRVKIITEEPLSVAMLPGPLSRAHAKVPETKDCMACHENFSTPTNEKCLACHDKIAAVLQTKTGYHGTLTGKCSLCHTDHKGIDSSMMIFDRETFNHDQAQFALQGQHKKQDCAACHTRVDPETRRQEFHFIGLQFTNCTDCHSDPHNGRLESNCTSCHNEQGWAGRYLLFEHNTHSDFKLDKIHENLTCNACHIPAPAEQATPYHGLASSCQQCHQDITQIMQGQWETQQYDPDPHFNRIKCTDCHNTEQPAMSSADYAQNCVNCHNEHYHKLFYDWSKAIHQDQVAIQRLYGDLDKEVPDRMATVGFHNIQMAHQLNKQYLDESSGVSSEKEPD